MNLQIGIRMRSIYNLALILSVFLTCGFAALANENSTFGDESFAIHPKAGLMSTYYSSDFKSFQGTVDCGVFTNGKGLGWDGGLFFEKDFNGDFQIGLGASLINRSGISTVRNTYQSRDQSTGRTTFVTLENKLDTRISYLEFSPEIRYVLVDNLINGPFRFLTGIRFGIPVEKEFEQSESVVSPDNATFINNGGIRSTTRPMASGAIENMSTQVGISAGFENMLKIGGGHFFTQQIVFDYNFNNIVSDAEWKTFAFRLDLGIRFSLQNSSQPIVVPEPEPEPEPVTIIVKEEPKPLPYLRFSSFVKSDTKLETGNEILATLPLVNSIFFPKNSADIPAFYVRTLQPNLDMYHGDAVAYHKSILPVIAKIINENPNSRIMLEGATSGALIEPKGLELSKARIESVKSALIELGVPSSSIAFRALAAPRYTSNQQYPEGIEENQRVDIRITDAPLQRYVNVIKFSEIKGIAELDIDYGNYPPNTKAMVSVNNQKMIYDKPGKYIVPFNKRIELDLREFAVISKVNVEREEFTDKNIIKIDSLKQEVVDLSLDNFEAILRFNFNNSDLTEENQALLKQLINKLPDGSTILIIGSTDVLGTAEHNQQLASDRARKTENFIKNHAGSRINIQTTTNIDKFSDDTPQGRFLNRSIKIRVK